MQKDEALSISYDDTWFISDTVTSVVQSDASCLSLTYSLFTGSDCSTIADPTMFELLPAISPTYIMVYTSTSFTEQTLCLRAITQGLVEEVQKLSIEVCGSEVVTLVSHSDHSQWQFI
jgi:hypothetical protein